jgi:spore coat polysaccharide biosynthesis protein SpsF (cytidylyltransferase family)
LKTVAIIQARMSSTRLPGKVLMPLLDVPLIVFMARRVRRARLVDEVTVATSVDSLDDPLARELVQQGISCFRGDLNDVLDRFYRASSAARANYVVRLTGDCPLMDGDLIDTAIGMVQTGEYDYVSNVDPPTFPDGLDVEAFSFEALQRAWQDARLPSEREHVTLHLRNRKDLFRTANWTGHADLSSLRWTIDHADDLEHVRSLLEAAGVMRPEAFDRFDLYRVCERNPSLNAGRHERNEGLAKSLLEDAQRQGSS